MTFKILPTTVKLVVVLALALAIFTSCRPAGLIYTEDGRIECGGNGKAIILTNNVTAIDPTFSQLIAFIKTDKTDTNKYITDGPNAFVCADFAEVVHNNAEAAGIRSGWVSLSFDGTKEGHALNAFETSDKGLVYIDCTNSGGAGTGLPTWDAIAYIETGKPYGVLPVERVLAEKYDFYSLEYAFYSDCEKAWQEFTTKLRAYNNEVDRYNKETSSRVFIFGSPEAARISAWKEQLASQQKELESLKEKSGDSWLESEYSSFLVKSVNIHW